MEIKVFNHPIHGFKYVGHTDDKSFSFLADEKLEGTVLKTTLQQLRRQVGLSEDTQFEIIDVL